MLNSEQFDTMVTAATESRMSRSNLLRRIAGGGLALIGITIAGGEASARRHRRSGNGVNVMSSNSVSYTGQGLLSDDFGGFDLRTEICDGNPDGILENGADAEGPYLLWVLTATKANKADITGPWGTAPMIKVSSGTFKFVSDWIDPTILPLGIVATYDGARKNAQLTISHGCRPYKQGAWCSPGFWRNAEDAAWALIGRSKGDQFNSSVVPDFYDTTFLADPTLDTTLNDNAYKSGTLTSKPYGLTPFNATGAFLTNNLPGFQFDYDLFLAAQATGETTYMCPIDHHGDFKQ